MNFPHSIFVAALVSLGLTQIGCGFQQASEEDVAGHLSSALDIFETYPMKKLRQIIPEQTGDWSPDPLPFLADTYLYGVNGDQFSIFGYSVAAAHLSISGQLTYKCPNSPFNKIAQFSASGSFGGGFFEKLDCVAATSSLVLDYNPTVKFGDRPFGDGYLATASQYNFYTTVSLLGSALSTVSRTLMIDLPTHQDGQAYALWIRYSNRFGASGIKVGFQSGVDGATLKAVRRVSFPQTYAHNDYTDWRYVSVAFTPTPAWGTSFYARLQYVDGADTALDSAWILPVD